MDMDRYVSIKEAAALLGVSDKTIRRRIQRGQLTAEMMDSVYGQQYFISKDQIQTAQQVIDVVKVKKEFDMQELALTLANYLNERDSKYADSIDVLKESVDNLKMSVEALKDDNAKLTEKLEAKEEEHFRELDAKLRSIVGNKKKKSIFSLFK